MSRIRKSTMVELVTELERIQPRSQELQFIINEAKAGEYHDYKNNKYACGKLEASRKLRLLGYTPIAMRIEDGEFDEEADAEDLETLKGYMLELGLPPNSDAAKAMLGL